MDVNNVFAVRLKQLREEQGLSQSELADKLGISRGSISFYENKRRAPDISVLMGICTFFSVSSDYLLGLCDIRSKQQEYAVLPQFDDMVRIATEIAVKYGQFQNPQAHAINTAPSVSLATGVRLRELRKERGITQKELAQKLGISSSMVGQYEAGLRKPKFETLKKFAEALCISINDLFDTVQASEKDNTNEGN